MFRITDIDQSVVAAPHVGMNHGFHADTPTNNGLQRFPGTVGNDLGINFTVTFEDAEDDRFTKCSATVFASDTTCAEVGFINFDSA